MLLSAENRLTLTDKGRQEGASSLLEADWCAEYSEELREQPSIAYLLCIGSFALLVFFFKSIIGIVNQQYLLRVLLIVP